MRGRHADGFAEYRAEIHLFKSKLLGNVLYENLRILPHQILGALDIGVQHIFLVGFSCVLPENLPDIGLADVKTVADFLKRVIFDLLAANQTHDLFKDHPRIPPGRQIAFGLRLEAILNEGENIRADIIKTGAVADAVIEEFRCGDRSAAEQAAVL